MLVEQAIYTSAQTDRATGYQVVAHSSGITEDELREISAWAPSHDSLLDSGDDAVSINFHPLSSGSYCISRTTPAGSEYSGRKGSLIYTQCLVVSPELLSRFANNPFSLVTAAFAQGSLRVHEKIPDTLEPFRLGGKASLVDSALIHQLTTDPGFSWIGSLVEAALHSSLLGLLGSSQPSRLVAGLINCLPPSCRTQFSFSTGLKFCTRRPYRILSVSEDSAEQRRMTRHESFTFLDFHKPPPPEWSRPDGWGGFISCVLASGNTSFLSAQFADMNDSLSPDALEQLGRILLDKMARSVPQSKPHQHDHTSSDCDTDKTLADDYIDSTTAIEFHLDEPATIPSLPIINSQENSEIITVDSEIASPIDSLSSEDESSLDVPENLESVSLSIRNDALLGASRQGRKDPPHTSPAVKSNPLLDGLPPSITQLLNDSAAVEEQEPIPPAQSLGGRCPQAWDQLEELDDTVFDAIAGNPAALEKFRKLWSNVQALIGPELIEESREHYLRHILHSWKTCVDGDQIRNPLLAIRSMELVWILLNLSAN